MTRDTTEPVEQSAPARGKASGKSSRVRSVRTGRRGIYGDGDVHA
jgi:hypothetical protein